MKQRRMVMRITSKDGGPLKMPKLPQRNEKCWCGSGDKYKKCHERIDEKKLMTPSVPDQNELPT